MKKRVRKNDRKKLENKYEHGARNDSKINAKIGKIAYKKKSETKKRFLGNFSGLFRDRQVVYRQIDNLHATYLHITYSEVHSR